jgi:hypothetical protein
MKRSILGAPGNLFANGDNGYRVYAHTIELNAAVFYINFQWCTSCTRGFLFSPSIVSKDVNEYLNTVHQG